MFYCIEAVQFTFSADKNSCSIVLKQYSLQFSADKNSCSIVLKQYSLHLVQTKTHVLLY